MRCTVPIIRIFILLALFCLIFPQKVHAYLDPGTGSYIIQVMIGFLVGGMFAAKLYWKKFKAFLSRKKKNETNIT